MGNYLTQTGIQELSNLVASFSEAMRAKLWKKLGQGYHGWNDETDSAVYEQLEEKFHEHVKRFKDGDVHQLVDIANLAAMLWWHNETKLITKLRTNSTYGKVRKLEHRCGRKMSCIGCPDCQPSHHD
jgi:hypothetical protein